MPVWQCGENPFLFVSLTSTYIYIYKRKPQVWRLFSWPGSGQIQRNVTGQSFVIHLVSWCLEQDLAAAGKANINHSVGYKNFVIPTDNWFMFNIVEKIFQTNSVVDKSAAASLQELMALTGGCEWWLIVMVASDKCPWQKQLIAELMGAIDVCIFISTISCFILSA